MTTREEEGPTPTSSLLRNASLLASHDLACSVISKNTCIWWAWDSTFCRSAQNTVTCNTKGFIDELSDDDDDNINKNYNKWFT